VRTNLRSSTVDTALLPVFRPGIGADVDGIVAAVIRSHEKRELHFRKLVAQALLEWDKARKRVYVGTVGSAARLEDRDGCEAVPDPAYDGET
jgi:hypothetical protein